MGICYLILNTLRNVRQCPVSGIQLYLTPDTPFISVLVTRGVVEYNCLFASMSPLKTNCYPVTTLLLYSWCNIWRCNPYIFLLWFFSCSPIWNLAFHILRHEGNIFHWYNDLSILLSCVVRSRRIQPLFGTLHNSLDNERFAIKFQTRSSFVALLPQCKLISNADIFFFFIITIRPNKLVWSGYSTWYTSAHHFKTLKESCRHFVDDILKIISL